MVAYCETVLLQDLILQAMSQKEVLAEYERKIKTKKEYIKVSKDLKNMGKPTLLGNEIKLTQEEFKELKALAKKGVDMQDENRALKKELKKVKDERNFWRKQYDDLKDRFEDWMGKFRKYEAIAKPYLDAAKYAPEKVKEFIRGILNLQKQEQEQQRQAEQLQRKQKRKNYDRGR